MQKLVLALLTIPTLASALPSFFGGKDTDTHKFQCGDDEKNQEGVDCNAECKRSGGWTGKAVISNSHEFRGISCLCNDTETTRISANEGETTYVEQRTHVLKSKSTPFTAVSKCWNNGWKGQTKVVAQPERGFVNPRDRQYCTVVDPRTNRSSVPILRKPGTSDVCDYSPSGDAK